MNSLFLSATSTVPLKSGRFPLSALTLLKKFVRLQCVRDDSHSLNGAVTNTVRERNSSEVSAPTTDNGKRPDLEIRSSRFRSWNPWRRNNNQPSVIAAYCPECEQQRGSRTRNFKKILLQQTCCFFHSLSKPMAAGETPLVSFC